jgi:hypothetical protein
MNPCFRIFKGEFAADILNCLDRLDKKFIIYADGDRRGKHWISNNFVNYKLFYIWSGKLMMFNINDFEENSYPSFIVYFNDDIAISEELWDVVYGYLCVVLNCVDCTKEDIQKSVMFDAKFDGVEIVKSDNEFLSNSTSIAPQKIEDLVYTFQKRYLDDIDVCLYEVQRNANETPFTVVVNNFKKINNENDQVFFTDIYGSNAWDCDKIYARYDYTFLCKLWKHLGLLGEFNMEIVKNKIDSCLPSKMADGIPPIQEPRVYRKKLDECISHVYSLFGNI